MITHPISLLWSWKWQLSFEHQLAIALFCTSGPGLVQIPSNPVCYFSLFKFGNRFCPDSIKPKMRFHYFGNSEMPNCQPWQTRCTICQFWDSGHSQFQSGKTKVQFRFVLKLESRHAHFPSRPTCDVTGFGNQNMPHCHQARHIISCGIRTCPQYIKTDKHLHFLGTAHMPKFHQIRPSITGYLFVGLSIRICCGVVMGITTLAIPYPFERFTLPGISVSMRDRAQETCACDFYSQQR